MSLERAAKRSRGMQQMAAWNNTCNPIGQPCCDGMANPGLMAAMTMAEPEGEVEVHAKAAAPDPPPAPQPGPGAGEGPGQAQAQPSLPPRLILACHSL